MAGFILCRTGYAKRPYYISNMAINIYSLEELCYYMYNNIYLIGSDLFDAGLIEFIERELKEEQLARQIEFLVAQNAGLSELVLTVLRYVDYYSEREVLALKSVIDKLDTQNVTERLKARADNFLANNRYGSAIRNYETIVYGRRDPVQSDVFYGSVWHNMGVAYAKMYAFSEAAECFERAYERNRDEESYNAQLSAMCLKKDITIEEIDDEHMYVAYREVETLMDHAPEEAGYMPIKKAFVMKVNGDVTEYNNAMDDIVKQWKADYRNYIR